jgi:cell division protein FtsL
MKLDDVKALWPLLTVIVVLSGFYYTTQLRLEQLETSVVQLRAHVGELENSNDELSKNVAKLQKKVNQRPRGKTRK